MRVEAALADQRLQRFGQVVGDGYYALLAALAAQEHLRPRLIEVKIAQVDAERLGDTRTGTVKLSGVRLCGSGGGRVSVPDDDIPRPALCRLSLPGRTHRIRGVALFPLPAEPAYGLRRCWQHVASR